MRDPETCSMVVRKKKRRKMIEAVEYGAGFYTAEFSLHNQHKQLNSRNQAKGSFLKRCFVHREPRSKLETPAMPEFVTQV